MTQTFAQFAAKPRSEKIILATVEAVQELKLFELFSGSVYRRDVDHFISGVKVAGVSLTQGSSTSLSTSQFYFDEKNKKLYVRMSDDSDPKTKRLSVTYKFFFANGTQYVPHDLVDGEVVEFEGRISGIGSLGQQLDDENTGIVLESSSNLALFNSDGYFDDIFDTLIWENQAVSFYSWSPVLPISEAQRLFSGVIEDKAFSVDMVQFNVKDLVYKLRNDVNLGVYSTDDGSISPSMIGKPKRRIYGKVKNAKCVGVDNILSGYALTGSITVALDSKSLSGSGTAFLDEISPEDELFVIVSGETYKLAIDSITSDSAATLGDESPANISGATGVIVKPSRPWRKKNRRWHIAGHKLHEASAEIVSVVRSNRFLVDNVLDFEPEDLLYVNSVGVNLRRISGQNFILNQSLFPVPAVGDTFTKIPVSKAYFGSKELQYERDWTLENTDSGAVVVLDDLAEFNLANTRSVGVNLTFTNGSRSITTASTIDLRSLIKQRDWIRKNKIDETDWYEVLEVQPQSVTIRTAFAGTTQTTSAHVRNIDLVDDDSLITVDCIGMGADGFWLKTPSDIVKNLVTVDAGFSEVDEDAFSQAKSDCRFTMSLLIPESVGDKAPSVKDVITLVNESVFGSLYGNSSQEIAFSVLNARKPTFGVIIKDDDILSWSADTKQKIVNKVRVNYRPFTDVFTGMDAVETVEYANDFVNELIGIENVDERTVYLYDYSAALIIAQRVAFVNSLPVGKISLRGKLNFALTAVNDKIYIELQRLFKRYGGKDSKKIAMVTGVKKNGTEVDIEMTDLGNIFNRVPVVAPNTTPSYSSATRDDAVLFGFIVDNDTLAPNVSSEVDFGNNRIG